jgi:TPP-dependent trihydroxycyclohexane-1,2-dione (THcHDO) dehydratase
MANLRLTAAEATIRFLAAQQTEVEGRVLPLFGGVWAIFGHGNVAGLGPALHAHRRARPTFRAHNEQAMAHAAIAYAKTHARRRMMACTTSIGPGATNMVTAAAVAHVNRLPVLFLPGDVFASRRPDPVLQQVECFGDATVSANDCFRPVSRFFDRILRAEQLLVALPAALRVLTDPAECGPVTLAVPQDVQTEALDWPAAFFRKRIWRPRAPEPDARELAEAAAALKAAKRPVLIAGGGVKYAKAEAALAEFAQRHGIPVAETQAGKGSLAWDHPRNTGAIGVTGTAAANALAKSRFDQTAQAIKGVGANSKLTTQQVMTLQYTVNDVIASMSTGMSPMTILMQQGGQVTQAFGGLRGTIMTLGSAIGVIGGVIAEATSRPVALLVSAVIETTVPLLMFGFGSFRSIKTIEEAVALDNKKHAH